MFAGICGGTGSNNSSKIIQAVIINEFNAYLQFILFSYILFLSRYYLPVSLRVRRREVETSSKAFVTQTYIFRYTETDYSNKFSIGSNTVEIIL